MPVRSTTACTRAKRLALLAAPSKAFLGLH